MNEYVPCDQCGARSFVFIDMPRGELSFCGSHYTTHQHALTKVAVRVVDLRYLIDK